MSSSDWNFVSGSNGYLFVGGISGSAVEHATISSPLTSSGIYCRGFSPTVDGNLTTVAMIAKTAALSSSLGLDYGYTYSLRTWFRAGPEGNSSFSLVFKGKENFDINYTNDWNRKICSGYKLEYRANGYYAPLFYLHCSVSPQNGETDGNDSTDPYYNSTSYVKLLNSPKIVDYSKWNRVRMDVASIGAADRITIYLGDEAGTWTSIHTVDIPQTKTAAYIPWATAGNPLGPSAVSPIGRGQTGYLISANGGLKSIYIDQFEAYREPT